MALAGYIGGRDSDDEEGFVPRPTCWENPGVSSVHRGVHGFCSSRCTMTLLFKLFSVSTPSMIPVDD